jgi:hypothetical protein
MCRFIAAIMPALDPDERATILGGMHAGAPPEIFELFRAATEAALRPAEYEALAGRFPSPFPTCSTARRSQV